MPNYLTLIDEEIAMLQLRLDDLKATKRVLATLQHQLLAPPAAKPKPKLKRGPRNLGALKKARKAALDYLDKQTEPKPSREIVAALATLGASDSTVWKALKELRDDGLIRWDEETRYYSIMRAEQQVAS